MKKWLFLPLILILIIINVDAKCGDNFCDLGEDCNNCADDCLCTRDKHDELVNCTAEFTSKECEKGYCHDRWCNTLEGFQSIFKTATCSENGSLSFEIKFQELDSTILTPDEDLKVYMKQDEEATFEEIKGIWFNPSREGEFRYTKISGTSDFNSDTDLFKAKGDYYVRVKYQIGRSNSLFEDKKISCPGMPQTTAPAEEPAKEEPKEEVVEEKPLEPEGAEKTEAIQETPVKAEQATKGFNKNKIILYTIIGAIILALLIFLIKYEIKIAKKIRQQ